MGAWLQGSLNRIKYYPNAGEINGCHDFIRQIGFTLTAQSLAARILLSSLLLLVSPPIAPRKRGFFCARISGARLAILRLVVSVDLVEL